MTKPHTREETRLRKRGYRAVAGVDEAGRGAWAGPIVAAAVILPERFDLKGIADSKQLSPKQRERLFVRISQQAVSWAVMVVPSDDIDRHGLQAANRLAFLGSLFKLHRQPDAILIDGYPVFYGTRPVKAIVKGDANVASIAAASIVAKVCRDALMDAEHRRWPAYGFHRHKGYGTAEHHEQLRRHGLSSIHRRSFHPMNTMA